MIETVKQDLKALVGRVKTTTFAESGSQADPSLIAAFFRNELFPMFEAILDEVEETRDDLDVVLETMEGDTIDEELAAVIMTLITSGRGLIEELRRRISPTDAKMHEGIKAWLDLAASTEKQLTPADDEDADAEPENEPAGGGR